MTPATNKNTRKTIQSFNPHALPIGIQGVMDRFTNARIKDLVNKGVLSVNAEYRKAAKPVDPTARAEQTFIPRMDVYDNPLSPNLIATFEIPGVKTADMTLSIKEGALIIQGERRSPMIHCGASAVTPSAVDNDPMQIDPSVRARVQELRFGRFHRAIPMPAGVQQSNIQASMVEGMLTVSWPRSVVNVGSRSETDSEPPLSQLIDV